MKEYLKKIMVGEFRVSGEIEVDINLIKEKWSHLWYINYTKFGEDPHYRLVKLLRKDSEITDIKITISKTQAMDIVKQLNLTYHQSSIFKNAGYYNK